MGRKSTKLKRAAKLMARYANRQLYLLIALTWAFLLLYIAYNEAWKHVMQ